MYILVLKLVCSSFGKPVKCKCLLFVFISDRYISGYMYMHSCYSQQHTYRYNAKCKFIGKYRCISCTCSSILSVSFPYIFFTICCRKFNRSCFGSANIYRARLPLKCEYKYLNKLGNWQVDSWQSRPPLYRYI